MSSKEGPSGRFRIIPVILAGSGLLALAILGVRAWRSPEAPAGNSPPLRASREVDSLLAEIEKRPPPPASASEGFRRGNPPRVEISQEGETLYVGTARIDLRRPGEEFKRLLELYREAHRRFELVKRHTALQTLMREVYTALAEMLKRFPELGLALWADISKEPGSEFSLSVAKLLKLSPSEALVATLRGVIDADAPAPLQRVAVPGLEHRPQPEVSQSLLRAWERPYTDALVRESVVSVLAANVKRDILKDEPLRERIIGSFRAQAQATTDGTIRTQAVRGLIFSLDGHLKEPDRLMVQALMRKETDERVRRELTKLYHDASAPVRVIQTGQ